MRASGQRRRTKGSRATYSSHSRADINRAGAARAVRWTSSPPKFATWWAVSSPVDHGGRTARTRRAGRRRGDRRVRAAGCAVPAARRQHDRHQNHRADDVRGDPLLAVRSTAASERGASSRRRGGRTPAGRGRPRPRSGSRSRSRRGSGLPRRGARRSRTEASRPGLGSARPRLLQTGSARSGRLQPGAGAPAGGRPRAPGARRTARPVGPEVEANARHARHPDRRIRPRDLPFQLARDHRSGALAIPVVAAGRRPCAEWSPTAGRVVRRRDVAQVVVVRPETRGPVRASSCPSERSRISRPLSSRAAGVFSNGDQLRELRALVQRDGQSIPTRLAPGRHQATAGRSPPSSPAAATISGEGVSPAASAAASGSPPGSAAATASAEAGRSRGVLLQAAQDHALHGRVELGRRCCEGRRGRSSRMLARQLGEGAPVEDPPAR